MKRTILALITVTALSGAANADRYISNNPPSIQSGTNSTTALLRMKKAGWMADAGRCLNAYRNVCEMDFVNQCGAVVRATFLNQRVTALKLVTFIDNPPTGKPQYPPCRDGTD